MKDLNSVIIEGTGKTFGRGIDNSVFTLHTVGDFEALDITCYVKGVLAETMDEKFKEKAERKVRLVGRLSSGVMHDTVLLVEHAEWRAD